jgi:methionyl-tRNA formyltransferase
MRLVFFGTSDFALPILEALVRSDMRPVLVVTTPDSLRGRKQILSPSSVKIKAQELGIEIIQPKTLKDQEVISEIASYKPDVGVLAAYGKIIPKVLIDIFPKGILNIHPSLLPRWRGPTPIQAAILAGDEKTGVTIILLDEEVDHGPIISNFELKISNFETYESLHEKLSKIGADLIVETLPKWLTGDISPTPQDHSKATFCKKFTFEDGKIDWAKSAEEIARMIRALNPEPGTYTKFKDKNGKVKILKILAAQPFSNLRELENKKVGEIFAHNAKPVVKCAKSALILERVQPEGKKPMTGEEFLRGHTYLLNLPRSDLGRMSL